MIQRIIAAWLLLSICAPVSGQLCFPVKKTFAYFQPVTPGNAAKSEVRKSTKQGNYYLYLESRREGVSVSDIWIDGVHYAATIKQVTSPVSLPSTFVNPAVTDKEINKVLVPPTRRFVYQVMLHADSTNVFEPPPARYEKSPVIFRVKYRNKTRVMERKEIIVLDPVGMM